MEQTELEKQKKVILEDADNIEFVIDTNDLFFDDTCKDSPELCQKWHKLGLELFDHPRIQKYFEKFESSKKYFLRDLEETKETNNTPLLAHTLLFFAAAIGKPQWVIQFLKAGVSLDPQTIHFAVTLNKIRFYSFGDPKEVLSLILNEIKVIARIENWHQNSKLQFHSYKTRVIDVVPNLHDGEMETFHESVQAYFLYQKTKAIASKDLIDTIGESIKIQAKDEPYSQLIQGIENRLPVRILSIVMEYLEQSYNPTIQQRLQLKHLESLNRVWDRYTQNVNSRSSTTSGFSDTRSPLLSFSASAFSALPSLPSFASFSSRLPFWKNSEEECIISGQQSKTKAESCSS